MSAISIAAVLPTRDRTALAMAAVRSLQQQDLPVEIYVSDNSIAPDGALRDFCRASPVHYLRPPQPLAVASHWDWAIRQAMERSPATHFTVHYDRKITKPGAMAMLHGLAARWPDLVITWPVDYVTDVPPPLRLWQAPWSGYVYALQSSRMVQLTAAGRAGAIPSHVLPLLSNCLVPRAVLSKVIERFGDLCDSTTPDSCFAYRFFTMQERYLYFDRALGILYASERSAGREYLRGRDDQSRLDAAPIPDLNVGMNMLYHEYERVRRATGALPPLDRRGYLRDLASSLVLVDDLEKRAAFGRVLAEHGWSGGGTWRRLRAFVRHTMLGVFEARFRDDDEAVRHALAHPRPRRRRARHLALFRPVQVDAP